MKGIPLILVALVSVILVIALANWFITEPNQAVTIEALSAPNYIQMPPAEPLIPMPDTHQVLSITAVARQEQTLVTEENASHNEALPHLDPQAIDSMRAARIYGDPRAPTLSRAKPRVLPNDEELADPDLYLKYQARQRQKVFVNFIQAAGPKIDQLNEMIQIGIQRGISQEELEQGREKVRRLEDMVKQLKEEHPEIIDQLDEG